MHLVCMFVISGIHVFNKGNICFYNAQFCTLSWSFIWRDYSECVFVVLCTSYSPLKWFIWMLFIMIINTDTFKHKSQLLKSQIKCQYQTFCLFVLWTESLKLFLPMCQQESFILQCFNFLKYNNIMIIYNIEFPMLFTDFEIRLRESCFFKDKKQLLMCVNYNKKNLDF